MPTLDRPARYQVKVPGETDRTWEEWARGMSIEIDCDRSGGTTTTLTGTMDQAALHGVLRRLYDLGLPLISVICIDWLGNQEEDQAAGEND